MLIWSVAIAKNNYVDLGLSVRTKNKLPSIKTHAVFSLRLFSLPLSPFRNISLSLSVCSAYDLPLMISHKKRIMFMYDY